MVQGFRGEVRVPVKVVRTKDVSSAAREYARMGFRCVEEPENTAVCVKRVNEIQEYVVVVLRE